MPLTFDWVAIVAKVVKAFVCIVKTTFHWIAIVAKVVKTFGCIDETTETLDEFRYKKG